MISLSKPTSLKSAGFVCVAAAMILFDSISVRSQERDQRSAPVIVQPGAPGQPTRKLSPATQGVFPPFSAKDIEFMQGMIMHHAQAVEMTDLIAGRTDNKNIHLIGARISKSQLDEIAFMKQWLEIRGQPEAMQMKPMHGHGGGHAMLMPGMLSPKQMEALKNASGPEFDRLFLTGMIQHHNGALEMVKDLFESAGAGQDAVLFNFASDVDTGQRAEIRSMQTLLAGKP